MPRATLAIVSFVFLVAAAPSPADTSKPISFCMQPPLPAGSDPNVPTYVSEVQSYRSCIEAFITEQRTQADGHLKAAQRATDEWEKFVKWMEMMKPPRS